MYNVLIVDDQKSSQALMKYAILLSEGRYNLVNTIFDADDVMKHLVHSQPDLILLDIYTLGKENGIIAAEQIRKKYPKIKIIILTYLLQKKHIDKAKEIGCEGFWYKDHADLDLLEVMDNVMAGQIYYPDSQPVVTIGTAKSSDFTKKELEILQAKINGLANEEICELLDIKRPTINTHITNIKNKTGYSNFIQLVADVVDKKFIINDDTLQF